MGVNFLSDPLEYSTLPCLLVLFVSVLPTRSTLTNSATPLSRLRRSGGNIRTYRDFPLFLRAVIFPHIVRHGSMFRNCLGGRHRSGYQAA